MGTKLKIATGQEEKREPKENNFRCNEKRYGKSWCKGKGHNRICGRDRGGNCPPQVSKIWAKFKFFGQ